MTGVSAAVVAARAPDPGLADRGKALVILGPAATDVGETPGLAPPYCGPTPRPVLHGSGRTLVTPHLALADGGGIQDSTPVFPATPGLDVADSGGTLKPDLAPFRGIPGLPPAVDWVTPGMSPADVWGTPGRIAAHSEETRRAPSFLLGSTSTPRGPVSPAKLRWSSRRIQALGLPAAGCASAVDPWPNLQVSQTRAHVQPLGRLAPTYDVSGRHVGAGQERLLPGRPC